MVETAVKRFYESLEFYREEQQTEKEDIRNIIDILESTGNSSERTFNYEIWEYADRNINLNFRDLGYDNPEDLIGTLEYLEFIPDSRKTMHSLKPLNLISEKLFESI